MSLIPRRPLDERGSFTVLGLLLFVGMLIPIFILVSNLSIITNASSQAHGLAYNLAFAGANRGVDGAQTRQAGSVVMLRESLDGINPATGADVDAVGESAPSKVQKLGAAYAEVGSVASKMKQAANLTGGSSRSDLSIVDAPATPATTGYAAVGRTEMSGGRPMALYSVPFDPIDAAFYTRVYNSGNDCDVAGGGNVGFAYNPTVSTCWVDARASLGSAKVRGLFAGGRIRRDRSAYIEPSQWAHYTSGAETRIKIDSTLMFGGHWIDEKIGVASFGRPCDNSRVSDIFGNGSAGAGSHCQY